MVFVVQVKSLQFYLSCAETKAIVRHIFVEVGTSFSWQKWRAGESNHGLYDLFQRLVWYNIGHNTYRHRLKFRISYLIYRISKGTSKPPSKQTSKKHHSFQASCFVEFQEATAAEAAASHLSGSFHRWTCWKFCCEKSELGTTPEVAELKKQGWLWCNPRFFLQ